MSKSEWSTSTVTSGPSSISGRSSGGAGGAPSMPQSGSSNDGMSLPLSWSIGLEDTL